ncbi:hypothetical protein BMT54_08330 [Pasteurellaceae bacterium 15-036681]|nr:hypothetical protein BMT54_08330 [Pasteurellaceae bacterium 15-036681]
MGKTAKRICRICGGYGIVSKSEQVHIDLTKEYCLCKNTKCGYRWVNIVEFSHTVRKSKLDKERGFELLIERLTHEDLTYIQEIINNKMNCR